MQHLRKKHPKHLRSTQIQLSFHAIWQKMVFRKIYSIRKHIILSEKQQDCFDRLNFPMRKTDHENEKNVKQTAFRELQEKIDENRNINEYFRNQNNI